ncbi:MAG: ABC transporter ATP-binding protein [Chlamydiota bacterium]
MPPESLTHFILRFMLLQKWTFFFIFLFTLAWPLDATVWPYLLRRVVDILTQFDLNRAASWPALKGILFFAFSLWITVETGFRAKDFLLARAIPKLEAAMRLAMFDHIQHHSPHYFNKHFSGSLSNKINDMTNQVTKILLNILLFFPAFVICIVSIAFFSQINAVFAFILGGWVVLHTGICIAFTPKCAHYSHIHGEVRSSLMGKIVDSLSNNFAVNLFSRFSYERARIEKSQKEEQKKNYLSRYYAAWMLTALSAIFVVGGIFLNGLVIFYWMQGKVSTGEIIQIVNTTWNVVFVLWFAGSVLPEFFQSIGIARQALSVMHDPQDVNNLSDAEPLASKHGEIIFENVSFHYGEKKLFTGKNVHIKGGEKVGLVGYSGAGKSTFVNLILRFYPVEQGRILIDGQDIAHVTHESLHAQVTLIPQDPVLFHRTLEENIRYGRIEATEDEVIEAAKLSHADEFIKKCPNGYDSLVGERGAKLSGGERQRIAIARAMLSTASILIFDEATSALDSVTERYIQDSLEKLMENRTTIVIAHRLSTLSKMDRILVFDHGKIVEEGAHNTLIAKGGLYARMWQMQAGGFLPE